MKNNIFKQTIAKSLKDNEQLIYSKKINISINDINNFPLCEISDIRNIIDIDNNLVGIISIGDIAVNTNKPNEVGETLTNISK